ncbi:hypothetical protein GWK47_009183 [Chionoecetes opilio]|uniref:Uncharacterized protein n=1 Tax=Chionoecetes opilio TaxID=41210 RepID=A0A8J5C406_CHIOP|nr:hypothetical protein GWK47_009183 [Chionoecetes opilio]
MAAKCATGRILNASISKIVQNKMTVPEEFEEWHAYNERFLTLISKPPSKLTHHELKPHLNTLLVDMDYLPHVNRYVNAHLNVSTARKARKVYTLLDLYSAQDPLRHWYLQQMRETLEAMFERYPEFMKQTVPMKFILDGFDRHVREMKRQTYNLYRRVVVPAATNMNLLAYYCPGRLPSLDLALTRHSLPSPYMRAASVEVIRLPDGEVALLHQQGGRAYFLGQSRQAVQNGPPHPDVLQPSLHHGYPGRSAHWILLPRRKIKIP